MEVIALVGPSGTGKSHRALIVSDNNNIDTIIDDGLLISGTKIIAGYSAKKEPNKMAAVRRAVFTEERHAREVSEAIEKIQPKKILILGTSDRMVEKIAEVLSLPEISRIIRIEDVATESEILKAREVRIKEGKHIIPVPTIELKPHFSGYLIDPLQVFFRKSQSKSHKKIGEKSIIRPTFSYYGKLIISDSAISAIVGQVTVFDDSIAKVGKIIIKDSNEREKGLSISVNIIISLNTITKYDRSITSVAQNAQHRIKHMVELMTGMIVREVNILVKLQSDLPNTKII